jgi:hypothetical protein
MYPAELSRVLPLLAQAPSTTASRSLAEIVAESAVASAMTVEFVEWRRWALTVMADNAMDADDRRAASAVASLLVRAHKPDAPLHVDSASSVGIRCLSCCGPSQTMVHCIAVAVPDSVQVSETTRRLCGGRSSPRSRHAAALLCAHADDPGPVQRAETLLLSWLPAAVSVESPAALLDGLVCRQRTGAAAGCSPHKTRRVDTRFVIQCLAHGADSGFGLVCDGRTSLAHRAARREVVLCAEHWRQRTGSVPPCYRDAAAALLKRTEEQGRQTKPSAFAAAVATRMQDLAFSG